ncbi:hypothetical protein [Clostridium hydrogeniformans]|uniref:hypothetical protein n=1 Tax=Clostridium hydrogeniformans TaxID=349933 RepID=UPI000487E3A4|nr:hypothetical protein [Clostridium hydrogeniformans]
MVYISIILILALAGGFYYFMTQLEFKRKQIMILSKENSSIKDSLKAYKLHSPLTVNFSDPPYSYGEIVSRGEVLIAPLNNASLLCKINSPMKVMILCKAELLNSIWYEVTLDVPKGINSRGWVKKDYIVFDESNDIITSSHNKM